MKKSIICGSCGVTMLIATHAVNAMPIYVAPVHDAVLQEALILAQKNDFPIIVGARTNDEQPEKNFLKKY